MIYFAQFTHTEGVLTPGSHAILYSGEHRQAVEVTLEDDKVVLRDNLGEFINTEEFDSIQPVELSLCSRSDLSAGDVVYMNDARIPPRTILKIEGDIVYFSQADLSPVTIGNVVKKNAVVSEKAAQTFVRIGRPIKSSDVKFIAENTKTGDSRNINDNTQPPRKGEVVIALLRCPTCGDFK